MKRLVQVVPYYNPPHVGGMEMRARERAERLARLGWQVETLTSAEQTHPCVVNQGNVVVRYLRSWEVLRTPIIFALPLALWRVPKQTVIQVETAIAFSPEVTALICRLRRIPYVARVPLDVAAHSRLRQALLAVYQQTVLRWVYRHAAAVVVLTVDDIALLSAKYRIELSRIRVVPNATDFVPLDQPRLSAHEPFRLLYVGRVAAQKNLLLLIESLRLFIDTYALPVHLDLVGDGERMPQVRKAIAERSLEEYISLPGYVTGKALEQYYEDADAIVLTSARESFGQVLIEAKAKGLPAIVSNIPGVRTVIADGVTGLLADLNAASFAAALSRLITEEDLYEKLALGALESAVNYSWETTVASYISLYEEMSG